MEKAILFDWNKVLDVAKTGRFMDAATEKYYAYDDEFPKDLIRKYVVEPRYLGLAVDYERNYVSPTSFWQMIRTDSILRGIKKEVMKIELNAQVWDALTHLSDAYAFAIVADAGKDKAKIIKEEIARQHMQFERVILSYARGRLKCQNGLPSLYSDVAYGMGYAAEQCIVVDGNLESVEGARKLGFKAVHYTGQNSSALRELII